MNEINDLLLKCNSGLLGGAIENCIVVAHDNGYIATATNAAIELERLKADKEWFRERLLKYEQPTIIEKFPMNFPKDIDE